MKRQLISHLTCSLNVSFALFHVNHTIGTLQIATDMEKEMKNSLKVVNNKFSWWHREGAYCSLKILPLHNDVFVSKNKFKQFNTRKQSSLIMIFSVNKSKN